MPATDLLTLSDIGFAYPGEPAIFTGASMSVGPGVTLLYGDTGSGKSTLLHIMAGRLRASGQQRLAGVNPDTDRTAYERQVFFVDPATDAFDQMTGHACSAALRYGDAGFDEARWRMLVDGFSLGPQLDKPLFMLSTGSKRKVWLAAALASGRTLVLLDEPTYGLDAGSRRCLWDALTAASRDATRAIVVASSDRTDQVPFVATLTLPPR